MVKRLLDLIDAREGRGKAMMGGRRLWGGPILLLIATLLAAGCPKRPEVEVKVAESIAPETAPAAEIGEGEEEVAELIPEAPTIMPKEPPFEDVFFDSNEAVLREDAKETLDAIIDWLKANPQAHTVIEGHADERGNEAYNLALGKRRANVVRDYLVAGGIDPTRLHPSSLGERQPFVPGHDEAAWMQNRRVHFVLASEVKASLNNKEEKAEKKNPSPPPQVPSTTTSPLTLGP
ncbi:MAG: OmpA family protein [Candidatus Methylomirabilales bacterium]